MMSIFTTFSLGLLDSVFHFSNTDFPFEKQLFGIYSNLPGYHGSLTFYFVIRTWINWNIFSFFFLFKHASSCIIEASFLTAVGFCMRLPPLIPIRVRSLTRQLVYRCDQHSAQHKEKRQSLSLYDVFLIVTFQTNGY